MNGLIRTVKNNSSLILAPASAFAIYLLISRHSQLQADDLYFFLGSLIAVATVLDGGLPHRTGTRGHTPFSRLRTLRQVRSNLLVVSPLLAIVLFAMVYVSPYGAAHSHGSVLAYAFLALATISAKLFADTLRITMYRSHRRMQAEYITSAAAISRLICAAVLVGRVPFLHLYLVTLLFECAVLAKIQGIPLRAMVALPTRSQLRLRYSPSYVAANFAYNVSFNLDRGAGYFVLPSTEYRALVGVTSLYNMAILPHKLTENETLYPSLSKISPHAQAFFVLVGCGFLAVAVTLLVGPSHAWALHYIMSIGILWTALTCFYNHAWADKLRSFEIQGLSRVNLVATGISVVAVASVSLAYQVLIPVGLVAYSVANAVGASLSNAADMATFRKYILMAAVALTASGLVSLLL